MISTKAKTACVECGRIKRAFAAANDLLGISLYGVELSPLPLNFASSECLFNRVGLIALSDDMKQIEVDLQSLEIHEITMDSAAGILAHEYGRLYQRRVEGPMPSAFEECAAGIFAGYILADTTVPYDPYFEFLAQRSRIFE